jgi:hypothetical protein
VARRKRGLNFMKKVRVHALVAKKKAKSFTPSPVNRLKKRKAVKKSQGKRTKVILERDIELEREQWKKQRRDYWKRRFRRLLAN